MDPDLFRNVYLGEPVGPNPLLLQLTVEEEYLKEEYDRFLPHDLQHGVAFVHPDSFKYSVRYAEKIKAILEKLIMELEIPKNDYRQCKRMCLDMTHEEITKLYNSYEKHYVKERLEDEEKENNLDASGE